MFTKKDRKIKNQAVMISNRDILIRDMERQAQALYEENKKIRFELEESEELIKRIERLISSNKYNNEKAVLDKIKELVSDYQSIN
jgi:hypothetical protein